jgi:hypothetical protein
MSDRGKIPDINESKVTSSSKESKKFIPTKVSEATNVSSPEIIVGGYNIAKEVGKLNWQGHNTEEKLSRYGDSHQQESTTQPKDISIEEMIKNALNKNTEDDYKKVSVAYDIFYTGKGNKEKAQKAINDIEFLKSEEFKGLDEESGGISKQSYKDTKMNEIVQEAKRNPALQWGLELLKDFAQSQSQRQTENPIPISESERDAEASRLEQSHGSHNTNQTRSEIHLPERKEAIQTKHGGEIIGLELRRAHKDDFGSQEHPGIYFEYKDHIIYMPHLDRETSNIATHLRQIYDLMKEIDQSLPNKCDKTSNNRLKQALLHVRDNHNKTYYTGNWSIKAKY